ncbi:MAG: 4-hydroxy-tetrahydrodipicolinate synthase [Gammaproteobacteria bacterium]|jgi:4-hydroxy-tetrahydrodipicolinate synthase
MFHGSLVALVTPMDEEGGVDDAALANLIEFHVSNGTDAIVAVGTTGESATLDFDEHCRVIQRVVELAAGRIPVIAGTGSNSTAEAIELTRCAMQGGADAALLVTPYYNKPTQEGLYRHFRAVAEAVPIPQILYNVPGRTAVDMRNETVERLADISNVVGIKDATGDLERGRDLIERVRGRMDVYSGDDATAMELILAGGKGDVSVTANVVPAEMHAVCEAALRGDRAEAERLNTRIAELHSKLFIESNPIPVKWALHEMGLIGPGIRLPLTPLSENARPALCEALRATGIALKS